MIDMPTVFIFMMGHFVDPSAALSTCEPRVEHLGQLELGMTLDRVENIIGCAGVEYFEATTREPTPTSYLFPAWDDTGGITIRLQRGIVTNIDHFGME